jgi:hypothetical protein
VVERQIDSVSYWYDYDNRIEEKEGKVEVVGESATQY